MSEQKEKSALSSFISWVLYILAVVVLSFLCVTFVGQRTKVIGQSMYPSLHDGDQLIVDKISYRFKDPKRFDVVVFPYRLEPDKRYIKRIIGMPGEKVQIIGGEVYINGEKLEDPYGKIAGLMQDSGEAAEEITLADDEYFVLGDNRNNSKDSRWPDVGPIHRDEFIGRAWLQLYPFDHFGLVGHGDKED
ncbi:MAG: signal peptidase I [Lachnospiraceae bacterium]|nr:signal peptidase I [Lachnospiraceae bacterium]